MAILLTHIKLIEVCVMLNVHMTLALSLRYVDIKWDRSNFV